MGPLRIPNNGVMKIVVAALLVILFLEVFRTCNLIPGPSSDGHKEVPKILQQKAQEGREELEAKVQDLEAQLSEITAQTESVERKLKRVRTVEFVPASEFLDVQYLHRPLFYAPNSDPPYELLGGAD